MFKLPRLAILTMATHMSYQGGNVPVNPYSENQNTALTAQTLRNSFRSEHGYPASSSASSMRTSFTEPSESARESGVGILMHQDASDMRVYVKTCVKGGSADRDGRIMAGDAILSIDGRSTAGHTIGDIRAGIVGIQGSSVRIGFQRNNGDLYEAVLIRGSPEYFESLQAIASSATIQRSSVPAFGSGRDLERSMKRDIERGANHLSTETFGSARANEVQAPASFTQDAEVLRLRARVNDLENDLRMTRDELGRTRQLLDHDREASLSYVREIDTLQKKYSEQIIELQGLLNQSEKVRRELEIQVNSGRAREEEFHEAFRRAKEQAEAREQYYADLKRKVEAERGSMERGLQQERDLRQQSDAAKQQAESILERMMAEIDRIKEAERKRREAEDIVVQQLNLSSKKLNEARSLEERCRMQSMETLQNFSQWHNDFFSNKTREEAEMEQFFLA